MADLTYENALKAMRAAHNKGDMASAKRMARLAKRLQGEAGNNGAMAQVNQGIAQGVGGLVDMLNPFDEYTGSAQTGIEAGMDRLGIARAQGDPDGAGQAFLRGAGEAVAVAAPIGKGLQYLGKAGGFIGGLADDVYRSLASWGGATAEATAGGVSRSAEKSAEDVGAPEWVQNTAAVAAPTLALPAVTAAPRVAAKVLPTAIGARHVGQKVREAIAPYTDKGAADVARTRLQSLAGGEDRAAELARRIDPDDEFGLTPAQQTQDPNMLAVEKLAAAQDPNVRVRLEARADAAQSKGDEAIAGVAGHGRVEDAQSFFEQRRVDFRRDLAGRARKALEDADQILSSSGPNRTEADNSLIVSEEIDAALGRVKVEEKRLWDEVPKDETVDVDEARRVARQWWDDLGQVGRDNIPEKARRWILGEDGLGDKATVRDMHQLYSDLRETARSARAGTNQQRTMARVADDVADAILDDLGAFGADTPAGMAINEARAYSAELHEVFDRGAVGRLRKRTIDGDTAIDPELALKRTVGRGGVEGDVAARQIDTATEERASGAIKDYVRDVFVKSALDADGQFTQKSARRFIRNNGDLLRRYPDLRDDIIAAVRNREDAGRVADRIGRRIASVDNAKRSAGIAFLNGAPDKAINSILTAKSPARSARRLANEARKDDTGAALSGLKRAFTDHMTGNLSALDDKKTVAAMNQVFSGAEMRRLRYIAQRMRARENTSAANIGESLSGAKPNKVIEMVARIAAARSTTSFSGDSAGTSLQAAQMASGRMKEILGRLVSDKASQMLADAVEDPKLFKALLTDTKSVTLEDRVLPRIAPYLIGTIAVQGQEN